METIGEGFHERTIDHARFTERLRGKRPG